MTALVVLRPEPGLTETVAAARAIGIDPLAAPLFEIEAMAWHPPDAAQFDAILAGSANAFRHGGPALGLLTGLQVHAVGAHTAAAAREAGFTVAEVGHGGLQPLLDRLAVPLAVLRLAGKERTDLAIPPGVTMTERVVYRARPRPLEPPAIAALQSDAVALLHSGAAARHFAQECDRLAIDRAAVTIAALAPRIAEAAGSGWRGLEVAPQVSDAALLAMAARLCNEAAECGSRNGTE